MWSLGCASGQELYSLAMLFAEYLGNTATRVELVGSDLSAEAISRARRGRYPAEELLEIPRTWRARYCERHGDEFSIRSELRHQIIFAKRDALRCRPFCRIDLILCRNVLLYFTREAQDRVLASLHFVLNDGGYMVLGANEAPTYCSPTRELRIYRRMPCLGTHPWVRYGCSVLDGFVHSPSKSRDAGREDLWG